jgi:hypothetical protein
VSGAPEVRLSTRLALACGLFVGLQSVVFTPVLSPEQFMLASDVYRHAADAMLAGDPFYTVSPPRLPGYTFIYPPVVVALFAPHALIGSALGAYAVQTALNVAFGAGTTLLVGRALGRRGVSLARLDWLLIGAFTLVSAHSAITLVNGQVTVWLGFAVAAGLTWLSTGRESLAGVAFALAALVKVFPAALGLWLLRRRAWSGVGTAIATGLGGLALGAVLFGPDTTVTFFQDVLFARHEGETFTGRPDPGQTVGGAQRQVAALTGLGSPVVPALALLSVAPAVGSLYRRVDTELRRQTAVLGTIIGVLLVLPLQRLYMPLFAFPLLVVLCTLPSGRARQLFLVGLLFTYARTTHEIAVGALRATPLPAGVESLLIELAGVSYTFVLPTTLGLWLLLGACVLVHTSHSSVGGH